MPKQLAAERVVDPAQPHLSGNILLHHKGCKLGTAILAVLQLAPASWPGRSARLHGQGARATLLQPQPKKGYKNYGASSHAASAEPLCLRGMTWNHSRGYTPMVATAQRFSELHPGVEIVWEKRSLQEFADQPIDQLAEHYDLLVIDHPWVGFACRCGLARFRSMSTCRASFLADQAANSVGLSHRSYCFDGHQWALAIDAAAPVASWRPDLLAASDLPRTWDDLLQLARRGNVLMPGIPTDTLMNFYMVCSTLGEDVCQNEDCVVSPQVGAQALGMLRELALALDPVFWDLNPVRRV